MSTYQIVILILGIAAMIGYRYISERFQATWAQE